MIKETLDRSKLHAVQTPQAFPLRVLREVYGGSEESLRVATDDASLVEASGGRVVVVPGEKTNIKLTEPADLILAEAILGARHEVSIIPYHRSGYIVLNEQSFSVAYASPFDSLVMRYEKGVLERTYIFDGVKTTKTAMDYRAALVTALDEGVFEGFGHFFKETLSRSEVDSTPHSAERGGAGAFIVGDFGRTTRDLKRVTKLSGGREDRRRFVCSFKVVLPQP